MEAYSIGIDLGGTNLRAAAIDKDGKMLAKISGNTPVASGPGPVVDDMAQSVEKLPVDRASVTTVSP